MIPLRVSIKGFLSYRDEQVFDFRERKLWMLSGRNGAGKSTVFDAISFALFHQHRGGKSKAKELINWHCDEFVVTFDFEVSGETYRAFRREPRKGVPERLLSRRVESGWMPLEESRQDEGFDQHVRAILGMDYDTFCVCVLLRQGKVDRLLEVGPADRFDILSQIVDLSRYETLRQRADQRRRIRRGQAEEANRNLARCPEVSLAEITAHEEMSRAANDRMSAAQSEITRLEGLKAEARLWANLTEQLRQKEVELQQARNLIGDEVAILRDAARLKSIQDALPQLVQLHAARLRHHKAESELVAAQAMLNESIAAGAKRIDWEAARAANDTDGLVTTLRAHIETLAARSAALPSLRTYGRKRDDARQAVATETDLRTHPVLAPEPYEQLCGPEIKILTDATALRTELGVKLQTIAAALKEAQERLARFHEAGDAAECRYCGQAIPQDRREAMIRTFEEEITRYRTAHAGTEVEFSRAKRSVVEATQALDVARKRWESAVAEAQRYSQKLDAAKTAGETAHRDAVEAIKALPTEITIRIGTLPDPNAPALTTWISPTAYPTAADLTALAAEVSKLAQCRSDYDDLCKNRDTIVRYQAVLTERNHAVQAAEQGIPKSWAVQAASDQLDQTALDELKVEHDRLAGADDRFNQLETAKRNVSMLEQQCKDLGEQIDQVPEKARRTIKSIETEQEDAMRRFKTAQQEWQQANLRADQLYKQREQRLDLEWRRDETRREEALYDTLAKLLSPDNLQSYLLQGAEQQIVDYANEALSAFSGSELRLERRAAGEVDDDEVAGSKKRRKALDLLCYNTETAVAPLPLMNLSGSQKFRVAVSLALGIGQFASRTDARIQSVIIDEGFGSLDPENQSGMAAELQQLTDRMERILVVSHQETFADAFPDRIHITLSENGSHAEPILN